MIYCFGKTPKLKTKLNNTASVEFNISPLSKFVLKLTSSWQVILFFQWSFGNTHRSKQHLYIYTNMYKSYTISRRKYKMSPQLGIWIFFFYYYWCMFTSRLESRRQTNYFQVTKSTIPFPYRKRKNMQGYCSALSVMWARPHPDI